MTVTATESPCRKCHKRVASLNAFCSKQGSCRQVKEYRGLLVDHIDAQAASDPADDGHSTSY